MKRCIAVAALFLQLLMAGLAHAETAVQYEGQVHLDLPTLTLTVTDTGERIEKTTNRNILQVDIEAQDGSLSQMLTWESVESPAFERIAPLVRLVDMNFDGYSDLTLLAAQGARNVFYAFSLWDVEAHQFRPVHRDCEWMREEARFSDEIVQTELCNPELFPQQRMLLSDEQDGFYTSREIFYMFDGSYHLTPKYIWDVYSAMDNMVGETMAELMSRVVFLWDEQYPEEWYYGQEGVSGERRKAAHNTALDGAEKKRMKVANVDWVNLRKQDSKSSPSLAKLNAGEMVTVLVDACGLEDGWVRVLYDLGEHHSLTQDKYDTGRTTLTGYIWHSFLEPVEN